MLFSVFSLSLGVLLTNTIAMLLHSRRRFLRQFGYSAAAFGTTILLPQSAAAKSFFAEEEIRNQKLTILHTNDTHSRIEPFPMDGGKYQGLGGVARRAYWVDKIRKEEKNVLLLDAGDMFQGTPYFNFFKGEVEIKMMSQMRYDAATIGNHDFDGGIENLQQQMQLHANFPLINCNYNFADTPMHDRTQPFKVFKFGSLKIGVLGVGIALPGLVPQPLYTNTVSLDPIEQANKYAKILRSDYDCDYIVCLSHLGHSYKTNQVSDLVLAAESQNIDLIIGGHTHTFLEKPIFVPNKANQAVAVAQVGWAGVWLGRIDIAFESSFRSTCIQCNNTIISKE